MSCGNWEGMKLPQKLTYSGGFNLALDFPAMLKSIVNDVINIDV